MNIKHEPDNFSSTEVSVIVPLCEEEHNVAELVKRCVAALSRLKVSYEIILVDDGSRDRTWEAIAKECQSNQAIKGLSLSRNFGHQHALLSGLSFSSGKAVICMDGDLQHPPELIPEMYKLWKQNYKVVETVRVSHQKTAFFKRATSKYFYKFFTLMSGVPIDEGTSDFRLIDRRVVETIINFDDVSLFIRGAIRWTGYPSTSISYQEGVRKAGNSKYSFLKMIRLAASGIISFSSLPLKFGIWLGLMTSFLAFLELFYIFLKYLQGVTVAGWASTLGILSFLFGILFILLGCIGMYLANIHESLKRRPRFIVDNRINL